jgi:hypothetical protein
LRTAHYKLLVILVVMIIASEGICQPRVIKGTVYTRDGKKAAGVIVTADKSKGKYFTSFDGMYEINANIKSKWIKFTFPDKEEKLNIEGITRDVIDFGKSIQEKNSHPDQRSVIDPKDKNK